LGGKALLLLQLLLVGWLVGLLVLVGCGGDLPAASLARLVADRRQLVVLITKIVVVVMVVVAVLSDVWDDSPTQLVLTAMRSQGSRSRLPATID
jgi:hypothetical protein